MSLDAGYQLDPASDTAKLIDEQRKQCKKPVQTKGARRPSAPTPRALFPRGAVSSWQAETAKDPANGAIPEGVRAQAERCLENVKAIVEAAGATMADVVKVNVYMKDLANFAILNEVYAKYFSPPFPARTTVGAASRPGRWKWKIDAIVSIQR